MAMTVRWQVAAALAGGTFELGDRVACLRGTGSPPLAARGTVVGEASELAAFLVGRLHHGNLLQCWVRSFTSSSASARSGQARLDQGRSSNVSGRQLPTAAAPAHATRHCAFSSMAGIYDDDAVEVLFDEPSAEGTDLHGKARGRHGGMLPATQLLNLSKPQAVAATGACTAHTWWICTVDKACGLQADGLPVRGFAE